MATQKLGRASAMLMMRPSSRSLSCSALNFTKASQPLQDIDLGLRGLRPLTVEPLGLHSKLDKSVELKVPIVRKDQSHNEEQRQNERTNRGFGFIMCGAMASVAALTWAELRRNHSEGYFASFIPSVKAAEVIPPDSKANANSDSGSEKKKSRRDTFNFIADVVSEVAAAQVYIEIKDLGVRDYFTGLPTTTSNGSGFIVKEDGLILTNAHVVINKPRASVQVRLQDGRTFTGVVEDVDVKSDLATVRIPCKQLPVMPLGKSSTVRPGEFVIAMGSPLSLSNTITTGVVSAPSRNRSELGLQSHDRDVPEYIQTDAAITFGNSGGPLVNLDGEAIGINSMKVTPGISFAIPIDYAKEFLKKSEEARTGGFFRSKSLGSNERRYIGITMVTINPQIIEQLRMKLNISQSVRHGIVVFRIVKDSPADRAGLRPGDVVTHINGVAIHGSRDVYKLLEQGENLEMTVVRTERQLKIVVEPESAV